MDREEQELQPGCFARPGPVAFAVEGVDMGNDKGETMRFTILRLETALGMSVIYMPQPMARDMAQAILAQPRPKTTNLHLARDLPNGSAS